MNRIFLSRSRVVLYAAALGILAAALSSLGGLGAALAEVWSHRYLHFGMLSLAAGSFRPAALRLAAVAAPVSLALAIAGLRLRRRGHGRERGSSRGWRLADAAAGLVVAAGILAFAVAGGAPLLGRGGGERRPSVVFIGVDTLRADHLGMYGYERDTSPVLDRWAQGGTVFENCVTATPRTTQSLASILTGKYPAAIGVRNLKDTLPDGELSAAEIFRNAGYRTLMVVATGIPYGKIGQGFEEVVEAEPKSEFRAAKTTGLALDLVGDGDAPYFLFAFYRDPHMTYAPPEVVFDRDYRGPMKKRLRYRPSKAECVFRNDFDEPLRRHAVALYDSEIRYVDGEIGRLIEGLRRRGNDTVIVFFSDHGESLGEHDYYYDHGDLLYQPGLRVPLVIEGGSFRGGRLPGVVRTIDILPTVLAAAGITQGPRPFQGVDLASAPGPLEAYSESGQVLIETAFETGRRHLPGLAGRLRSLVAGTRKVIVVPREGGFDVEHYDLARDPGEVEPLPEDEEFRRMREKLLRWVERDRPNWDRPERAYSDEELDSLRSLGYL